jgi:hypothetical protein
MSGIIGGAGSKSGVIGTTELDYEEGTFSFSFTIAGTARGTQYQNIANYVKVGNSVTVAVENVFAYGTYTGTVVITTSLPFVPLSGGNIYFKHQGLNFQYISFNAGSAVLYTQILGAPSIRGYSSTANDGAAQTYSQKNLVFTYTYITS